MTKSSASRQDVYTRITGKIIADLEQGMRPWMNPCDREPMESDPIEFAIDFALVLCSRFTDCLSIASYCRKVKFSSAKRQCDLNEKRSVWSRAGSGLSLLAMV